MRAASVGPIPSRASSCSTVADERLTGPPAGPVPLPRRAAAARRARHEHLLTVLQRGRQVDRAEVGDRGRSSREAYRLDHPPVARDAVDARLAHRAGDVHEQLRRRALGDDRAAGAASGWVAAGERPATRHASAPSATASSRYAQPDRRSHGTRRSMTPRLGSDM